MSSDIISKAFTTTRPLELEYRTISLLREVSTTFETSPRIDKTGNPSLSTQMESFADAIWH